MELQFRALYILRNLVKANKEIAARIVATDLMDVLFAIKETKDERVANEKVRREVRIDLFLSSTFVLESHVGFGNHSNVSELWINSTEPRSYNNRRR